MIVATPWHLYYCRYCYLSAIQTKKSKRKIQGVHNHKPQPFPDTKRKRKPTNLNKHKSNKRTKSIKISSLFPKRGNRNTTRTEKHKNKMTHGKTYNKSPRRINHKATKSKTNTGTTALERSVEQTTGGFKTLLQLAKFTWVPMLLLIQKYIKIRLFDHKGSQLSQRKATVFANSLYPDETAHNAPSYLVLNCLPFGFRICHNTICHFVFVFCQTALMETLGQSKFKHKMFTSETRVWKG